MGDTKNLYDAHHGIAMGVVDSSCDDGKVSMTGKNHYIFVIMSYTLHICIVYDFPKLLFIKPSPRAYPMSEDFNLIRFHFYRHSIVKL